MASATILYVEDEETDVFFMRRALRLAGLEAALRVVADGQQAIDYLAGTGSFADRGEHPLPTLVLLDLNLPLISGFEVLRWLREQSVFQDLPVVVFSSSMRPEDQSRAQDLGANEYLQKPSSAMDFPRVVSQLRTRWLPARG